jgi:hypothetical protein
LFLYYINYMPENIRSKSGLFADDTIVYLTITSDIDSVSLQDDLNKLAKWEERWKMSFHPEKYNILTIITCVSANPTDLNFVCLP